MKSAHNSRLSKIYLLPQTAQSASRVRRNVHLLPSADGLRLRRSLQSALGCARFSQHRLLALPQPRKYVLWRMSYPGVGETPALHWAKRGSWSHCGSKPWRLRHETPFVVMLADLVLRRMAWLRG